MRDCHDCFFRVQRVPMIVVIEFSSTHDCHDRFFEYYEFLWLLWSTFFEYYEFLWLPRSSFRVHRVPVIVMIDFRVQKYETLVVRVARASSMLILIKTHPYSFFEYIWSIFECHRSRVHEVCFSSIHEFMSLDIRTYMSTQTCPYSRYGSYWPIFRVRCTRHSLMGTPLPPWEVGGYSNTPSYQIFKMNFLPILAV